MPVRNRLIVLIVALSWAFLCAAPAGACDVPVFRYALERWEPDVYGVLVFHDGPLAEDGKKAVDLLKKAAADRDVPCNMDVLVVDVSAKMAPYVAEVWKMQKDKPLPRIVVCYPRRMGGVFVGWAGALTLDNAKAITHSPARTEIYQRIIKGDVAVWVLLESGDKVKDDAAAKLLQETLKKLEGELELPVPAPALYADDDQDDSPAGPPLKVAFSVVRVSRKAAAERFLVDLLLHTEEDLTKEYASEPMTFAFFGQGRAMWALVGKGINAGNVAEVCAFLVDRCSCQVKQMNPGIDVLFAADWYAGFEDSEGIASPLPSVVAAAGAPGAAAQAVEVPPVVETPASVAGRGVLVRNTLIALGCVVLAAAGLTVWLARRTSRV